MFSAFVLDNNLIPVLHHRNFFVADAVGVETTMTASFRIVDTFMADNVMGVRITSQMEEIALHAGQR